jgi:uncharacterized protein YjbI with pentapeptide repeats
MMQGRFDRRGLNRIVGPQHIQIFRVRILTRVRWLLLRLWWREEIKLLAFIQAMTRPLAVLLAGFGLPFLFLVFTGNLSQLPLIVNSAQETINSRMEWREFVQLALVLIGLPTAFLLWSLRDHNVQATLKNQRKDVNLKSFQEVQMRAAGALDPDINQEARDQLQISALNQLRGFLRGEFGKEFQKPAAELLLGGQTATLARLGLSRPNARWMELAGNHEAIREQIRNRIKESHFKRNQVDWDRLKIIQDEWYFIIRKLSGAHLRSLDQINLAGKVLSEIDMNVSLLRGANLSACHLERTRLRVARLEGVHLGGAHLEFADLSLAYLDGATVCNAHLDYANLSEANLEGAAMYGTSFFGAKLCGANLKRADLTFADFRRADLSGADLDGADLSGAVFCDLTILSWSWDKVTDNDKRLARESLILKGATLR